MAIDWRKVQQRLTADGRDPGPADGVPGPRTYAALFDHMARRPLGIRGQALAKGAVDHFAAFNLLTPLRLSHFLAQATHETGDFNYLREIWGPTAAQKRYEGRRDLGNVREGDGKRYMGRGIFQLTGRANYAEFGGLVGVDLEGEPDLAARPDLSLHIACLYWLRRNINAPADRDDVVAVTRLINGGSNGLQDRQRCLSRAKAILC